MTVASLGQFSDAVGTQRGAAAADRLCLACVDLLDVDAASISLILDGANLGTLGADGAAARGFDDLQFVTGEGPCLESVALGVPVLVGDLAGPGEHRWPGYGPALLALQVHSVYALPILLARRCVGALTLFRLRAGPLGADDLAGALAAAVLAELALLDLVADDTRRFAPYGTAFAGVTRVEVNQATGVLMVALEVDAAEAMIRLRGHAFATGRSTHDVALDILDHGLGLMLD